MEAQLAETTTQLHNLKVRQRQLEARNHLLELAAANKQPDLSASVPQQSLQVRQTSDMVASRLGTTLTSVVHSHNECSDVSCYSCCVAQAEARDVMLKILERSGLTRTQQGTAFKLTVHGCEEEIRVEDISSMPHADLAKLYTVTVLCSAAA